MNDTVTLEIEGRRVNVGREFMDLTPEQQNATVDEIAATFEPRQSTFDRGMRQLNSGIADSVGGAVDFFNPFDKPHALNPFKEGTGSAAQGLERGMNAFGVNTAESAPEGAFEDFMRGSGRAAGALPFAGSFLRQARNIPGALGGAIDDAAASFATKRGLAAEITAGGGSSVAEGLAEDAGAPESVQVMAGVLGGGLAALPAFTAYTPTATLARKAYQSSKVALAPYTQTGAREVAKRRLQGLAGGEERAAELAQSIQPGNEFGLTPAQQTGDPMMLALEQAAASQDPNVAARLRVRAVNSNDMLQREVGTLGGDVEDAQAFLASLRQDVKNRLEAHIATARQKADEMLPVAQRTEVENSQIVAEEVRRAFNVAKDEEAQLWAAVPSDVQIKTDETRNAVNALIDGADWAKEDDIPSILFKFRDMNKPQTAGEMHSFYSKLREIARNAMAGENQNANRARMANDAAEAVLRDLGSGDPTSEAGRALDRAREYSRELHETFDRGAVGALLRRNLAGVERINPSETLNRTIGQRGVKGQVAQEELAAATGASGPFLEASEDYLVDQFNRAFVSADGKISPSRGLTFARDRAGTIDKYPELRERFMASIDAEQGAQSARSRVEARQKNIDNARNPMVSFINQPNRKAVNAVFEAQDPAGAVTQLVRQASRDTSGKALAGVKGAFADKLVTDSLTQIAGDKTLVGRKMADALDDAETAAALSQVFEPDEMRRIYAIRDAALSLDAARTAQPGIGSVSNATPNRLIELSLRIAAANHGVGLGRGAASLQTAQMASSTMKKLLGRLANDKAEKLLIDAVEDPELFKVLLMEPQAIQLSEQARSKIAPYLVGTTANITASEE